MISGFPGESEEEFSESVAFSRKCELSEIHCFPYSPRKGTFAYALNDLPVNIKKSRNQSLIEVSNELREKYRERFYGKELEVLFEEYNEIEHLAYGHTSNFLLVKVPSLDNIRGSIKKIIYSKDVAAD